MGLRGPSNRTEKDLPSNRSIPDFSTFNSKQPPRPKPPLSDLEKMLQSGDYVGGPHPVLSMVSGPITRGFGLLFGTGKRASQGAGAAKAAGRAGRGPTNAQLREQITQAGGSAPKSANKAKLNEILGGLRGEGRTQGTIAGTTTTSAPTTSAPTTIPRTTPQPAPQSTGPMRGPTGGFGRMTEAERNLRGARSQGDDFLAGLDVSPTPPRTTPPRTQQPARQPSPFTEGLDLTPTPPRTTPPRTSGGTSGRPSGSTSSGNDFLQGLDLTPTPPRTTPPRTAAGPQVPAGHFPQPAPRTAAGPQVPAGHFPQPAPRTAAPRTRNVPTQQSTITPEGVMLATGAAISAILVGSALQSPQTTKPKTTKPKATKPKTTKPKIKLPKTNTSSMGVPEYLARPTTPVPEYLARPAAPAPRSSVKKSKTSTPKSMPANSSPFPGADFFGGGFGPSSAGVNVRQEATPQFGFTPNTNDMVERKKKKSKKQYRDLEDVVSAISTAPIKGGSHLLRGIANFMYRLDD